MHKAEMRQRRDFMKTAAKVSAVFALLGISAEGSKSIISAEDDGQRETSLNPREKAVNLLFSEAMTTGDMESAIKKYRDAAQLTAEQAGGLRRITKAELTVLKQVRDKLIPLKLPPIVLSMAPAMRPNQ